MRRLAFAEPAERDLNSIIDYIALYSPGAAENIYRTIVDSARRLARFPEMGRTGRLSNTREFPLPSLPYLLVYEVHWDIVTIVAVFHGAQDLAQAFQGRANDLKQDEPKRKPD